MSYHKHLGYCNAIKDFKLFVSINIRGITMPRTTHNKPTNKIWRTRRNIRVLKTKLYTGTELKLNNLLKGIK